MAREETVVGLDVGTTTVRALVGQSAPEPEGKPHILGVGVAPSSGMQRGVVTDIEETIRSVSHALDAAERMAGVPIDHAAVSVSGAHMSSMNSRGVIAVSRADGEISEEDVTRAVGAAQAISLPSNREILHVIPQHFIVDGQSGITDPRGMTGVRLEVDVHIIEGSTPFIRNLTKCVYQAGVTVTELLFAPLAAARGVLSKRQKELGVVLLDLGGGTTSLAVYEDNRLIHTASIPVGSMHVTNDIAIGLRSSIDVAERIKLEFGSALPDEVKKSQEINLKNVDAHEEDVSISRRQVSEIIEARLSEIFSLVNRQLRAIDRAGMLPAGVVLTGGGAKLHGIVDLAKRELRLPAQLGFPHQLPAVVGTTDDPSFAVVVGLLLSRMETTRTHERSPLRALATVGPTVAKLRGWFRTLLP